MQPKFIPSTDSNEKCTMYSRKGRTMIMVASNKDEII